MKLRRVWTHDLPYTPAERAAYGQRKRAARAAEVKRTAERAAWLAANPPAYCTVKQRDAEGVLRYVEIVHGPHAGCDGCDRARREGVIPAGETMEVTL